MIAVQTNTVVLPPEQLFNFRGVWYPANGEPLLPAKYDAYIVGETLGGFEIGDWIIRDSENQSFIHIPVKLHSTITADILCVVEEKHKVAIEYFLLKVSLLNQKIDKLEARLAHIERIFTAIGEYDG